MAILTSPSADRTDQKTPALDRKAIQGLVGEWITHPLASFYLVLLPTVILLSLGMLMVLSASSVFAYVHFDDPYYFIKRQTLFLVLGAAAGWWLTHSTPQRLRFLGWVGVLISFVLLLLTFTPLGFEINGNRNWLQFGTSFFRIQPSEFAKLAMIVWGADVLSRKWKLLDQPKHLLVPFVPVSLLLTGLVVAERDLGTAMIMGAIMLAVLWAVGANWRFLALMVGSAGIAVALLVMTSGSRVGRILGFLNQNADQNGVNWQPVRAIWALASGGLFGLGLGASRQKWGLLMESHTDYILAVVGEELGLVGTLVVLALFLALGYAGLRISLRSDNLFNRYVSAGITGWFMIQALVNVMVVLRMLPVLGVPLPLLSYGGSALLANMMGLGVLMALARQEPAARIFLTNAARQKKARTITTVIPGRSPR